MVKTESVSEISFSSDCIHESCLVASVRMVKTGSSEICFCSECNHESCLVAFVCMVKTESVSEISFQQCLYP